MMSPRLRRWLGFGLAALGLLVLGTILILLRLGVVTDHIRSGSLKDPDRVVPTGRAIVAPADGTVLYVREIREDVIPYVVKQGVAVPVVEHLKSEPVRKIGRGHLVGIYMNTQGVHINRIPNHGVVKRQIIFNGPHMDMTAAELGIVLKQLVPGRVTLRKLLGLSPFGIENDADYILKSARETLVIEEQRGTYLYVVRIADYYVGKILTWVQERDPVKRGQKFGVITWGSQTDLLIETSPGLEIQVEAGDYVYAGQTVIAVY